MSIDYCPRCKTAKFIRHTATSRRDNETEICPNCGMLEAFEDSRLAPQWLDDPTHHTYWNVKSPTWLVQSERMQDEEAGLTALKEEANELS